MAIIPPLALQLQERALAYLGMVSRTLGEDDYILGSRMTSVDPALASVLLVISRVDRTGCLDLVRAKISQTDNLQAYVDRIHLRYV